MGIARKLFFKEEKKIDPKLKKLLDSGHLLSVDIAYAKLNCKSAQEIETTALEMAAYRQGKATCLPKSQFLTSQIALQIERLRIFEPSPKEVEIPPTLNKEQQEAVRLAVAHPFLLLCGGPGTGKTFTASQIIPLFERPLIAAPTAKAASHLASGLDGIKAQTLHSLLGISSYYDLFKKQVQPLFADLVLVDECSMIDPPLFWRLLCSIGPKTTLVLMGDPNQLAPVEGGRIFADLIEKGQIQTAHLKTCMRSDRKEILDLARAILNGSFPDIPLVDLAFETNSIPKIYQKLWEFVKEKDFAKFRILCPLRKGPLGTKALNQFLYEKFSQTKKSIPILITQNDPRLDLWNGQVGMCEGQSATFGSKSYSIDQLPEFEYAYCLSVHKSQGSEIDEVLTLIPKGSESFGREILYTAVTRAKERIYLAGERDRIELICQKEREPIIAP